jgi:hypothetical protein
VQPTGRTVRTAAELAAGVQLGEDDLEGRDLALSVLVDRDAASVVVHLDRPVAMERDLDAVAVPGRRFVDGVVDELPHEVQQPGTAGAADVHARTLADRVEALERLDGVGVVARLVGLRGLGGCSGHCSSGHQRAAPMASTRRP